MDSLRILQLCLLFSIPFGLLGILGAICRRANTAQLLGLFAILTGIVPVLGLGQQILSFKGAGTLAFALTPVALGVVALASANYFKNHPPLKRFQISVPLVLFTALVIAFIFGFARFSHDLYLRDREGYLVLFLQNPEIENVDTIGTDYGFSSSVEAVEFSLAGRPDTRIRLAVNRAWQWDYGNFYSPHPLTILQIGDWRPRGTDYATEPIQQGGRFRYSGQMTGFHCDSHGSYRELIPLELHSMDDIILHYDELVEMFASWPREAKPGRIELESEQEYEVIEYWVEKTPISN